MSKLSNDDKLGMRIKRLAASMHTASTTYNGSRKENTDIMRGELPKIREGYKARKVFNGQQTWTDWCRWACPNPGTKDPSRWFQKLVGERDPNSVRVTMLPKPGAVVKQHGSDARYIVTAVDILANTGSFEIRVEPYKEDEQPTVAQPAAPAPKPTQKRLTADETWDAMLAVKKSLGKDDHSQAWMKKHKDALVATYKSSERPWGKATFGAQLRQVEQYIHARGVTESIEKGWTKTHKTMWKHEDGRAIKRNREGVFTTLDKGGGFYTTVDLHTAMAAKRAVEQMKQTLENLEPTPAPVENCPTPQADAAGAGEAV